MGLVRHFLGPWGRQAVSNVFQFGDETFCRFEALKSCDRPLLADALLTVGERLVSDRHVDVARISDNDFNKASADLPSSVDVEELHSEFKLIELRVRLAALEPKKQKAIRTPVFW